MKKLSDYIGKKIAVNCTTPEQAEEFCKLMHENGLKWITGSSLLNSTNWDCYKKNTFYSIDGVQVADKQFWLDKGYEILPATDFLEEFVYGQEYEFSDNEDFKLYYTQIFGCLYPNENDLDLRYLSFDKSGRSYGWKYCRKINTERNEAITTAKELITKFDIKQEEIY